MRLVSNLQDVPVEEVRVGLEVEVVFEDQGDVTLPRFRRAGWSARNARS